jgi:hypothetical protein
MDPSDQLELLEPQIQIQSEFIDKDTVFEYLRVEGLSVNNLDSEQLTLTPHNGPQQESHFLSPYGSVKVVWRHAVQGLVCLLQCIR